jgi:hypothetical protein
MPISRRSVVASAFASLGLGAFDAAEAAAQARVGKNAPIPAKDNLKVTRLETFLVKPRWMFLKVHTNAGIIGKTIAPTHPNRLRAPRDFSRASYSVPCRLVWAPPYPAEFASRNSIST